MYQLDYEGTFDAAHSVPTHNGQCANLHGHTWRVLFSITAPTGAADRDGMVVDFGLLKGLLQNYDHQHLNALDIEVPTAENLGVLLVDEVWMLLDELHPGEASEENGWGVGVTIWESQKASVTYKR